MCIKSIKMEFFCKYIELLLFFDKDGGGYFIYFMFVYYLFIKILMMNKYKFWVVFIY